MKTKELNPSRPRGPKIRLAHPVRFEVSLEQEQYDGLLAHALGRGVSLSRAVREAVELFLKKVSRNGK